MGRDDIDRNPCKVVRRFQPTRPHGARPHGRCPGIAGPPVSTHAPAWGATASPHRRQETCGGFNPRARMGRDEALPTHFGALCLFQPTRPHGARRWPATQSTGSRSFNPRARMGRDSILEPTMLTLTVSTHAPAWGATLPLGLVFECPSVSTHAPAWGATHRRALPPRRHAVSTHAPAWGATFHRMLSKE